MLRTIKFILASLIVVSCSELSYENVCDIKSDQFLKGIVLMNMLGEREYKCLSYDINIATSVLEVNPSIGILSETGPSFTIGSTLNFTIRLKKNPSSQVEIQIYSTLPSLASLSTNSLIFTEENWSVHQSFTLTGINDSLINGDRNFKLNIKLISEDIKFNQLNSEIPIQLKDNEKRLFLSTGNYRGGEFGGINGADQICNADIKCPQGSTCKAMILSSTRIASLTANIGDGQLDWVLHPYTHYYLPNNTTLIANTNGTSLLQIPFSAVIDSVPSGTWLGSNSGYVLGSNDCLNWTDNVGAYNGYIFRTQFADNTLFGGNYLCSNQVKLFCVEF
ncbi:DUF1554 domain-containing protein [Leptospira sp. WS39.C2]